MTMDAIALAAMNEPAPSIEELDESKLDFGHTEPETETPEAPPKESQEETPSEETPQEEPKAEDEAAEKSERRGSGMIPRHRYNYAKQKRDEAEARARQLEQEVQQLRARQQEADTISPDRLIATIEHRISELDKAIEDARADNDSARATALRAEQRQYERALIHAEQAPPPDPQAASNVALEQIRVQETIRALEISYPMLEEGNEAFDAELSDEVMDTFEAFARKMPRDQALNRAVSYVLGAHGIAPITARRAEKRTTDVKKNLAAATAQPPALSSIGLDSNKAGVQRKMDVMAMSQEDFERLGAKEMDELLGNSLA